MMFRVRWAKRAIEALTNSWLQASSDQRQVITAAANHVEQRLRRDPHNEGESRPKGRRITFVQPLAVVFRIEADGQTVSVLQIRVYRRRGK